MSTFSWPPWVETWVDHLKGVTHIRVSHGDLHYDFDAPYGSTSRDTVRICYEIRAGLIQKQNALDAITARLKS